MTDSCSTIAPVDAPELIKTLTGYSKRFQHQHGYRPEAVTLPRALGKPEMAAGVRITPRN